MNSADEAGSERTNKEVETIRKQQQDNHLSQAAIGRRSLIEEERA